MRASIFASGSSGNCLLLSGGGTNILIDAGISMRRLDSALAQTGHTMRDIGGVLITHEHSDHISGLKMLVKHYAPPVYAPRTVANRLRGMLPEIDDCLCEIPVGESFEIGAMTVRAFHTPHDSAESVGYRVENGSVFALATDMGRVTDEILAALTGADTALIESNHDEQLLRYGPYPVYLKRRILSDAGHLSNENCARLARALADSGTERIVLGHLSRENNTPHLAMQAAEEALTGSGAKLYCAPVLGCLEVPVGEAEPCLR
ncbi:MAG: MBL fold metallo-hydrolase [Oscillospiraceae bacterium]|nr:MBL fold metallo-hydrolase [Oscillospiraceae bacterium]